MVSLSDRLDYIVGAKAADSLDEALDRAYQAIAEIQFDGIYYRRDIGRRALKKTQ